MKAETLNFEWVTLQAWTKSVCAIQPHSLFSQNPKLRRIKGTCEPVLCLGKAAADFYFEISPKGEALVICPTQELARVIGAPAHHQIIGAEHPLPGEGSFLAGHALINFFRDIGQSKCRNLNIFLSGGASSLLWLPPADMSVQRLRSKLGALYKSRRTIFEINEIRKTLCGLKGGEAGRWLLEFNPEINARVFAVSDVAPYGVGSIGSGPFYIPEKPRLIPHIILTSNTDFRNKIRKFSPSGIKNIPIFLTQPEEAVASITRNIRQNRAFVQGVEISWDMSKIKRIPDGGRLSHLALCVLHELGPRFHWPESFELFFASTDGVDGRSGTLGTLLTREGVEKIWSVRHASRELKGSLKRFDSYNFLKTNLRHTSSLMPKAISTGTNVQDIVFFIKKNGTQHLV